MIEAQLVKALLKASITSGHDIIPILLKAVSSVIKCKMCSFWKINNDTDSVSILAREHYYPPHHKEKEFVHPLKGSLIGYVIDKMEENKDIFFGIDSIKNPPFWNYYLSKERALELNLSKMICIPIINYEKHQRGERIFEAILNIYPENEFIMSDQIGEILRDQFSLAISRSRLLSRESLTREIMKIYESRGTKDLSSILHPIINRILRRHINYEGCSVFLWDPFLNRLNLEQTTGIEGKPKKQDVYYYLGEGITGYIAEKKEPILIHDLLDIKDKDLLEKCTHKWTEETPHPKRSFFALPIMRPSKSDELLGVIRITNKLNQIAPVVDYFDKGDLNLVKHACVLIALFMENEQNERIRIAFAMQMGHEMLTPAVAIKGSAERLVRMWNSPFLPEGKVKSYLNDILDHAKLQIALTRTIEYIWKGSSGTPISEKYQIEACDLKQDILIPSRKLVIPLARTEGLKFDNITISGQYPVLYVDKFAFEQVFFNLLTNAIKYRELKNPSSFQINIDCKENNNDTINDEKNNYIGNLKGFLLHIDDNGIGINPAEKDKIFLLGYRRKGIEKTNVRGLGLGLTVVKKILDDFYCKIYVSNYKKPTRLTVFIPEKLLNNKYIREKEWERGTA